MRLVEKLSDDCERRRCFGFYRVTKSAGLDTTAATLKAQAMTWAQRELGMAVQVGVIKAPKGSVLGNSESPAAHGVCRGGLMVAECAEG